MANNGNHKPYKPRSNQDVWRVFEQVNKLPNGCWEAKVGKRQYLPKNTSKWNNVIKT